MDKRFVLAIALAMLILLSWSALVSKVYHIENKEVTQYQAATLAPEPKKISPSISLGEEAQQDESLFTFSKGEVDYVFSETHASLQKVNCKAYHNYKFPLKNGLRLLEKNLIFKKLSATAEEISFSYEDINKKIVKRFIFRLDKNGQLDARLDSPSSRLDSPSYVIEVSNLIHNLSKIRLDINLPLVLGILDLNGVQSEGRYQDVTIGTSEKSVHSDAKRDMTVQSVNFLSLRDRYFCAILEPINPGSYQAQIAKLSKLESQVILNTPEIRLEPGQIIEQKFRIYLGPQELQLINAVKPAWAAVMHYGTFDFIAQLLLQTLNFLYRLVHNWGWAIVILSLLIYFLLYPLSRKQMRSMKEMQALQPKIEELRANYKNNPQRLNKEIMQLYREHKVNPFGGCLPMILQIPVFFALYQVMMRAVSLKGAHFLWIKDLAGPDRLLVLPVSLPIIGNEINILPIVMAIGMFIQQKLSMSTTASSSSAEQQKLMMIIFPLMFGFIFYHMPSGLVL